MSTYYMSIFMYSIDIIISISAIKDFLRNYFRAL